MTKTNLDPARLKRIAKNQRNLCLCILLLIVGLVAHIILYQKGWTVGGIGDPSIATYISLLVNIYAAILVILLAANVYNSTIVGIILGLLCLIPCAGLLVLLAINQQATRLLKQNGIKVGLIGANLSQFD